MYISTRKKITHWPPNSSAKNTHRHVDLIRCHIWCLCFSSSKGASTGLSISSFMNISKLMTVFVSLTLLEDNLTTHNCSNCVCHQDVQIQMAPSPLIHKQKCLGARLNEVVLKSKAETNLENSLSRQKASVAIQIRLTLAYFARLTCPCSSVAYGPGNHQQNLNSFPKLTWSDH